MYLQIFHCVLHWKCRAIVYVKECKNEMVTQIKKNCLEEQKKEQKLRGIKANKKPDKVVHAYGFNTQETEAGCCKEGPVVLPSCLDRLALK